MVLLLAAGSVMSNLFSGAGRDLYRSFLARGRPVPPTGSRRPGTARSRPFVLAATVLASAMAFIDSTVVMIALPTLQEDLGASFPALQWVLNAYSLLLGSLILIGGGAGDRFGRRRVFLAGIALFALASWACALASSAPMLIAARALQGIGAALLVPQSLAIIAAAFPRERRGRAIGLWAGASAIATALGPPLGGLLIDALDWRAVFWINLPLSAAAIALALRWVPESRGSSPVGPLDWPGGALAVLAFGSLSYGLTLLSQGSGPTPVAIAALTVGALGLAGFLSRERRAANPVMPLGLFRSRAFAAANAMTLFLYGAFMGMLFLLPFELIGRHGLSATEVGLTLLPIGLLIGTLSRPAGAWADRTGPRPFLIAGSLLVALAALGLALPPIGFWPGIVGPVLLLALGMALVVAPLTTAVMNGVADGHAGAASGVNNAASRLAGLFAVAILGAVACVVFTGSLEAAGVAPGSVRFGVMPPEGALRRPAVEAAFQAAYAAALGTAALWGLLSALIAALFLRTAPAAARLDRSPTG